jgi:hypothetical protein
MGYGDFRPKPSSKAGAEGATQYRERFQSRISAGNRNRAYGGTFTNTGGEKRPRLNTTLPEATLIHLDRLASEHRLQRNEVLALALETIAGMRASPEATSRFTELAKAWRGFGKDIRL